jgi:hypothetical protein
VAQPSGASSFQLNKIKTNNMLEKILAISGKPGLFKLISGSKRMVVVESLLDGKRTPAYTTDRVISLSDIAMYTEETEVPLNEVFMNIQKIYGENPIEVDYKKASETELHDFMAKALPEYDRERVHNSDIKKLIQWYNLLLKNGLTDFSAEGEEKSEENA